jgi:hypothetical protein
MKDSAINNPRSPVDLRLLELNLDKYVSFRGHTCIDASCSPATSSTANVRIIRAGRCSTGEDLAGENRDCGVDGLDFHRHSVCEDLV